MEIEKFELEELDWILGRTVFGEIEYLRKVKGVFLKNIANLKF